MVYAFLVASFSSFLPIAVLSCLLLVPSDLMAQRGSGSASGGVPVPLPRQGLIITVHGKLKELKKKQLTVQGDDERIWILRRTSKTKFFRGDKVVKPFEIDLETMVSVDMKITT